MSRRRNSRRGERQDNFFARNLSRVRKYVGHLTVAGALVGAIGLGYFLGNIGSISDTFRNQMAANEWIGDAATTWLRRSGS